MNIKVDSPTTVNIQLTEQELELVMDLVKTIIIRITQPLEK